MSRLDALLNQEIEKLNTFDNDGERDYPAKHLKHEPIKITQKNPEYMVRILPPTSDEAPMSTSVRELWLNAVNANDKPVSMKLALSGIPNPSDPLEQQVNTWINTGTVPNEWSNTQKPQKRFYLNAVILQKDAEGNYVHETDSTGNLVVRMLDMTQSLYQEIIELIGDDNFNPDGSGDFRIISATNAYPIRIYRKGERKDTTYHATVYQKDLGPLPQNWAELAEDLEYQATPTTYEDAGYIIAVANGMEAEYNASRKNGSTSELVPDPGTPLNQFQSGNVEVSNADLPSGMGNPTPQPVQQQPAQQQPTQPVQPTPPTQPDQPVQQQPTQPQDDTQSAINNTINDLDSFMNDMLN